MCCSLVGAAYLAAPAPSIALKKSFFGVQGWLPPSAGEFQKLGRNGVGRVRNIFVWAHVEPRPGVRDWSLYDDFVTRAVRARVEWLPIIIGSPNFAAADAEYPPMTAEGRAAFAAFIRDAVARYGRGGRFWSTHPGLAYRPVTSWQIWNEPNYPSYWLERPNAKEYVSLLALAAEAVRSSDPKARVVLAGLPETQNGIPATVFLRQIYRVPGARDHFDAVAINPYAADHRGVMGAVIRARRTMRRNGDGKLPLLVTEIGWATAGDVSPRTAPFRTSLRGQVKKLTKTFRVLIANRRRYRIDGVVWFSLADRARRADERNWWGINTGLWFADGRPKPAWQRLTRIARRH